MKFTIIRTKFIEALKSVQNIVAGKGSLAVLQNVLIDASSDKITLVTTDLDISIRAEVECTVMESGATTLPVKTLFCMISKMAEGEVTVSVDAKDRATITSGNTQYKLSGMAQSEFPKLPEDEEAFAYTIKQSVLKEMLRETAYAASQDDTRRTLKGVLMSFKDQKLTMVATDGRRLAMVENEMEFPVSAEKDIVLPSKAVLELQRSLASDGDVNLMVQKSQICFRLDSMLIYSKLMDDQYPNYRQVIPAKCDKHIKIDRQSLINALERASVMTMDEAHSIKLIFEEGRLLVTSAASSVGEAKDEVPIKYADENIEIMFNPQYVIDPLKAIDDDEVEISLNDGHSPAVINCSIPFIYVLMPLRSN